MKKLLLFASFAFSLALNCSYAQDTIRQSPVFLGDRVKLKISGFVRSDIFYDTHRNIEKVDGLFSLLPANASYDANGTDNNKIGNYRMTAAASRFGAKFTGPDLLKAKTTAYIEFDFTGVNGIGLTFRHAYIKLAWEKNEVLFGRYFHPMYVTDVSPSVLGINSGAPFLIYGRNEQIRYTWKPGAINFMIAASALMNYSFPSDGAGGYQHYQTLPDLTGNIQFKKDIFTIGASGNLKINQPRLSTIKNGKSFHTDRNVTSVSLMAYAQVKTSAVALKGGVTYGQSNNELNMLGGYAVGKRDTATMKETYTTLNNLNYWFNFLVGNKFQVGVFAGYSKNLGTSMQKILEVPKDAARGFDANGNGLDHLIRISPGITYKIGELALCAELEYSIAAYGKYDLSDYAKVTQTRNISNVRTMLTALYFF